jgi:hydroxymethylbilane synthase
MKLGTRGSRLALAQSGWVAGLLREAGNDVEIVIVKTVGDARTDVPFAQVGSPGVFVRELERALVEREVDLAVHSFKDVPSKGSRELTIAAVPERRDPRDVLFVRAEAHDPAAGVLPLVEGALVGTASARREWLLRDLRPDVSIEMLRGNVPTRIKKLAEGEYDAIVLAAAGVERLEGEEADEPLLLDGLVRAPLPASSFVPAPAQGALAVQVRAADAEVRAAVAALDDADARRCVDAERRLLAKVEGNCQVPFGAHCAPNGKNPGDGELSLRAALGVTGGLLRVHRAGPDPRILVDQVWTVLGRELEELDRADGDDEA